MQNRFEVAAKPGLLCLITLSCALSSMAGFQTNAAAAEISNQFVADAGLSTPICAGGSTLTGVDVSDNQPNTQWNQVQQSGRTFAFVKATQGIGFQNSDFTKDWAGSKAAGLIRSAYHYFQPNEDPAQQAQAFLAMVGPWSNGDLPPMLDLEISAGVAPATVIQNAQIWLNKVEQGTGMVPILYTNPGYWNSIGTPPGFDRYPLFIADYNTPCPEVPKPWTNWTFWQYAVAATTGIGTADQDYFNGALALMDGLLHHP
jgi:lysozyme